MAVLMTPPKAQFFDNSGDPLNGGKIYSYEAGTSTPKATYTDNGGGTPNANPVVLDSYGRADIWLSGAYKIVVKDSSDVTISTTDNITAFSNSSSSTFSDASWTLQDDGDTTKQFMVQLSGLTTGTTVVMTPPTSNFTAVGTSTTQTLTNKTLTSPAIASAAFSGSQTGQVVGAVTALTSTSNSIAINLATNCNFSHTFTENTTLANPSSPVAGQSGAIFFTQHASSVKTLAFGSYWLFPAIENGGADPAVTATVSAVDVLYYYVLSATQIACHLSKGYA